MKGKWISKQKIERVGNFDFKISQIINSGSHEIQFVGSSPLHVKETHTKGLGFIKDDFSKLNTGS